jgi:hypothetical protein
MSKVLRLYRFGDPDPHLMSSNIGCTFLVRPVPALNRRSGRLGIPMDAPRLLTDDISDLFSDLAVPDPVTGQPIDLEASLAALTSSVKRAVPSYRGLGLILVIDEQPVTVTSAERGNASDIATSLSLSLAWVPLLGPDSQITFYASVPGTFVDLAADFAHALGSEGLRLDGDIPSALVSDLTGVRRLSTINEAVGVLIGHGHTPDGAQRELRHMADTARISIHQAAEGVIESPSSARWD